MRSDKQGFKWYTVMEHRLKVSVASSHGAVYLKLVSLPVSFALTLTCLWLRYLWTRWVSNDEIVTDSTKPAKSQLPSQISNCFSPKVQISENSSAAGIEPTPFWKEILSRIEVVRDILL